MYEIRVVYKYTEKHRLIRCTRIVNFTSTYLYGWCNPVFESTFSVFLKSPNDFMHKRHVNIFKRVSDDLSFTIFPMAARKHKNLRTADLRLKRRTIGIIWIKNVRWNRHSVLNIIVIRNVIWYYNKIRIVQNIIGRGQWTHIVRNNIVTIRFGTVWSRIIF